ncbi:MAG: alanine racemase, partial [Planctomycetes bacterium]|nr:alanine racemase [Planctomycetota bacterium]
RTTEAFLEVNVSGEEAKHGLAPEELDSLLPDVAGLSHVRIQGLMTMASLHGGRDQARRDFAKLRELRDCLAPQCPPEVSLRELSMGMSGDFDIAVEEGATIVRVGSALFE